MSTSLKNIAKHSSVYAFGNVLRKSIAFLLIPIYTRYLTPSDYGMLEILLITAHIMGIVGGLGIGSGLKRVFLYDANNREQQNLATTTASAFVVFMSLLIIAPMIVIAKPISLLLFEDSQYATWFLIVFITGIIRTNNIVPFQIYQAELKSIRFTIINLIAFTIELVSNIYFIVYLRIGILGILYGALLSSVIVFLINFAFIRRYIVLQFSKVLFKKMLRFGLPLIPGALAFWLMSSADRYFLIHYSDTHEIGLYSMGFRFAVILEFILREPFEKNWASIYFRLAKQANAKAQFSNIFTYYFLIGSFLCLGISIFAKPVIQIMTTPAFYSAYEVVPLLAVAILFRGMSNTTAVGIGISGKTEYYGLTVVATALINLLLNYLLIPPFGMKGAALATMFSFVFMQLAIYLIGLKLYPIKYDFLRLGKIVVAISLPLYFHFLLKPESLAMELILDIGLCLSYILVLFALNFFRENEITRIRGLIHRRNLGLPIVTTLRQKL
ncbi:MAG: oligosaccharide flippase family protein [bacterium]